MTTVDRHTHHADPPTTARLAAAVSTITEAAGAEHLAHAEVRPDSRVQILLAVWDDEVTEAERRDLAERLVVAAGGQVADLRRAFEDDPPFWPPQLEAEVTTPDGLVVRIVADLDEPARGEA